MKKAPIIIFCIPNPKALWIGLGGLYNVWGGDPVPGTDSGLVLGANTLIQDRS